MSNKTTRAEPTLNVQLNEKQKLALKGFYKHKNCNVNYILGDYGTGKSLTAMYIALSSFRKKEFSKIWIVKPNTGLPKKDLKVRLHNKMNPYVYSTIQHLEQCQGESITSRMVDKKDIEIMPVDVIKGITFKNCLVIVDNLEDFTYEQYINIITRVGKNSKIIFAGHKEPTNFIKKPVSYFKRLFKKKPNNKELDLENALKLSDKIPSNVTTLTVNERSDVSLRVSKYLNKQFTNEKR
jgi:predicted ribonuclease YlaK